MSPTPFLRFEFWLNDELVEVITLDGRGDDPRDVAERHGQMAVDANARGDRWRCIAVDPDDESIWWEDAGPCGPRLGEPSPWRPAEPSV
jgi:hypothetical protein